MEGRDPSEESEPSLQRDPVTLSEPPNMRDPELPSEPDKGRDSSFKREPSSAKDPPKMCEPLRKRNPIAKALRSKALQPRVVRTRKGRGSYTRKGEKAALRRYMLDYS